MHFHLPFKMATSLIAAFVWLWRFWICAQKNRFSISAKLNWKLLMQYKCTSVMRAVCQSVDECILAQWWRQGLQMSVSGSVHESDKRFKTKTFNGLLYSEWGHVKGRVHQWRIWVFRSYRSLDRWSLSRVSPDCISVAETLQLELVRGYTCATNNAQDTGSSDSRFVSL